MEKFYQRHPHIPAPQIKLHAKANVINIEQYNVVGVATTRRASEVSKIQKCYFKTSLANDVSFTYDGDYDITSLDLEN